MGHKDTPLGVDSPFFSTIVLSTNRPLSLGFKGGFSRKDPWKEWKWEVPLEQWLFFCIVYPRPSYCRKVPQNGRKVPPPDYHGSSQVPLIRLGSICRGLLGAFMLGGSVPLEPHLLSTTPTAFAEATLSLHAPAATAPAAGAPGGPGGHVAKARAMHHFAGPLLRQTLGTRNTNPDGLLPLLKDTHFFQGSFGKPGFFMVNASFFSRGSTPSTLDDTAWGQVRISSENESAKYALRQQIVQKACIHPASV